jgi:hypothetical protein
LRQSQTAARVSDWLSHFLFSPKRLSCALAWRS